MKTEQAIDETKRTKKSKRATEMVSECDVKWKQNINTFYTSLVLPSSHSVDTLETKMKSNKSKQPEKLFSGNKYIL